ncbi:hypothetical protein ACFC0C_09880 [Streptomyces sp. NPDC056178]|uniref:hypothetical protein n=1 Tax=Streptomyces sp. NPDC056178 TaxID=3345735 RepID=UPI0035DCA92E
MNPRTPTNPTDLTTPTGPAASDTEKTGAEQTAPEDAAHSLDKGAAETGGARAVAAGDTEAGAAPEPAQDLGPDAGPGESGPTDIDRKDPGLKDPGLNDSESENSESENSEFTDSGFEDSGFEDSDKGPSGLGPAAAAVAAAGLGVVALSGSWTGKIAAERETLIGQIKTSTGSSAAQQISEIYGDAWHATALVNGLFALLAVLVGVFALVRPAFGAPSSHPQPGWVRAVATAGIALGVLGVVLSIGMYFDLIVSLPTAAISK